VGIGRPDTAENTPEKEDAVIGYVLSDFTPEERKVIEEAIPQVGEAIVYLLSEGLTAAMNRYN
jgi:peptidyl-tRNA hydrolase